MTCGRAGGSAALASRRGLRWIEADVGTRHYAPSVKWSAGVRNAFSAATAVVAVPLRLLDFALGNPTGSAPPPPVVDELERLASLRRDHYLTEDEYQRAKTELLGGAGGSSDAAGSGSA
jgi:hypothetical protein